MSNKKYLNPLLADTQQVYNNVKSPCVYFIEHKAKSGIFRMTDTQSIGEDGKKLKYEREKFNFLLLALRYKIKGESSRDLTISSPIIKNLSHPAPIYEFSTGGTEGQIGDRDYTWNTEKELINELPDVKKARAALVLFGLVYKVSDKDKSVSGTLAQIELSGGSFGAWINDSKGVDQTEFFNLTIEAEVAKRPNNHPRAEEGSMLSVPGFQFNELDHVIGEYFISREVKDMILSLEEYLDNRTYEPGKVMPGTADAVAAVAEQNSKSAADYLAGNSPIDDMNLDREDLESGEELPKMG